MSWRKYLLVPGLIRRGSRRTVPADTAWETYWAGIGRTGPEGDVLWDGAGEQELAWWDEAAGTYLDPSLPVVDVGCGNGRLSRQLAGTFPGVLGVDVSAAAVDVARAESQDVPGLRFRQLDVTAPDAGVVLADEVGAANVVVRGVFHVLDAERRRRAAAAIGQVLGTRGSLVLLETNWPGDLLGYLEHLGGRRGRLPAPLARLIDDRVPAPAPFGAQELAEAFPAGSWTTVASGALDIWVVRTLGIGSARTVPGFFAVLRAVPASPAADAGSSAADRQG